jgi:hypothetical protein
MSISDVGGEFCQKKIEMKEKRYKRDGDDGGRDGDNRDNGG